jgi:hypothetical protein
VEIVKEAPGRFIIYDVKLENSVHHGYYPFKDRGIISYKKKLEHYERH